MVVVVDLAGWPRFFVGAAVDPASWPLFEAVVGLVVGLVRADGLAIDRAVLTEREIAVGFSGLSL